MTQLPKSIFSQQTDADYLSNYHVDTLYVGNESEKGKFLTLVIFDVSPQVKIAIKSFYATNKADLASFEIVKIKNGVEESRVKISNFTLAKLISFCDALKQIDLGDASSAKLKFASEVDIDADTLRELMAAKPDLKDIYAIARKKSALAEFENLLENANTTEKQWQTFFQENNWIFGHGLNYVFLDGVRPKLEQTTTGSDFNTPGKIVDALMKTKAEISQYVLVEIKRNSTKLIVDDKAYRSGCWQASQELTGAVAQVQKTSFEFAKGRFRDNIKDDLGNSTGETVFSILPKAYLIVGNLKEIANNEDQLTCFELFRKNIIAPEIITFDELYERAKCIVQNVSDCDEGPLQAVGADWEDIF